MTLKRGIAGLILITMLFGLWIPVCGTELVKATEKQSFMVSIALELGIIEEYEPTRTATMKEFKTALNQLTNGEWMSDIYLQNVEEDQPVKLKDAILILCDILGYSGVEKASNKEKSMLILANQNDLLEGVSRDQSKSMVLSDLVNLFYNTLMAHPYVASTYSEQGVDLVKADYLYMEKALGYNIVEGIVQQTAFSSIVPAGGTMDNYMVVGGKSYLCETAKYEDFVGKKVRMLVKIGTTNRILALHDESTELFIDADDLENASYTGKRVTYYDRNNSKTVTLSPSVAVMFNHKFLRDVANADLNVTQGRLILIDNNQDSRYDVVKIEEYKSMEIFAVSAQSENPRISDDKGNSYSIDEMVTNGYPIYHEGKSLTAINIPLGEIGTIWVDKNGEVTRIMLGGTEASGTVVRIDKAKNIVYFEENQYGYVDEIEAEMEQLSVGKLLNVQLNMYQEITTFEIAQDTWKYGYLVAFGEDGAFNSVKAKIFTESGEFIEYKIKETISLNGVSLSAADVFVSGNTAYGFWDEAGRKSQIIKYRANGNKEIGSILTATSINDGTERMVLEKDGVYRYYATPKTIAGNVRVRVSTKVFAIPNDLSMESKYKVGAGEVMERVGSNVDLSCQIYDVDKNRYAGVIVTRIDPAARGSINDFGSAPSIVDHVGTTIGEDGEETTILTVHNMGAPQDTADEWTFLSKDMTLNSNELPIPVSELQRGDIIFASAEIGFKSNANLLYRQGVTEPYENLKDTWGNAQSTENNFYAGSNMLCAGVVTKVLEDAFMANFKPDTDAYGEKYDRLIPTTGTIPVRIMDSTKDKIYHGSVADLEVGDNIFVLMRQVVPVGIVIYR